ncbi:hypothetical protein EON83_27600 [bacterium]|nr:MAG: hypothetical protein EON83_27600 [bacterium]
MDIFKATDGNQWYISIDGDSFEWCQREPFLNDKLAAPADSIPVNDPIGEPVELTLSREQLEERGFTISKVTSR